MATTIFIVDDDDAVRSAISLLVKSYGWRALTCASANELFERVAGQRPACVLLDLQLPDMDGVSVQRELIRRGIDVPVIFTTAFSDHPLVNRAIQNGAHGVIAKPFKSDDLVGAITRVVDSPQ